MEKLSRLSHITKQLNSLPAVAGRSFLAPFIAGVKFMKVSVSLVLLVFSQLAVALSLDCAHKPNKKLSESIQFSVEEAEPEFAVVEAQLEIPKEIQPTEVNVVVSVIVPNVSEKSIFGFEPAVSLESRKLQFILTGDPEHDVEARVSIAIHTAGCPILLESEYKFNKSLKVTPKSGAL